LQSGIANFMADDLNKRCVKYIAYFSLQTHLLYSDKLICISCLHVLYYMYQIYGFLLRIEKIVKNYCKIDEKVI